MSEQITLEAKMREKTGKGYARKLRNSGWLPGVIVENAKSISIEINPHDLPKVMRAGKVCTLNFGDKTTNVRVQEVQVHPSRRTPLHVDFIPTK